MIFTGIVTATELLLEPKVNDVVLVAKDKPARDCVPVKLDPYGKSDNAYAPLVVELEKLKNPEVKLVLPFNVMLPL